MMKQVVNTNSHRGTYRRVFVPIWGSDVMTNGDFGSDAGWNKNDWAIGSGVASVTSGYSLLYRANSIKVSTVHQVSFDIVSRSAGEISVNLGGSIESGNYYAVGTHTFELTTTTSDGNVYIRARSGFTGSIDNLIIKEKL